MSILYNKAFLSPHHYESSCTLEQIRTGIEECFLELDIHYQVSEFTYHCIMYYHYREIHITIELFRSDSYIIELQANSGHVYCICKLRYALYQKGLISPVEKVEEEIVPRNEVAPEYIRSLFDSLEVHSSYEIQKELLYQLAVYSEHPDNQTVMAEPYVLSLLLKLCKSYDLTTHRCALSMIRNLLYSNESECVAHWLNQHDMIHVLDTIMGSTKTLQVKRECNLIYPFLE
jgi:hypothetical protein